MTKNNGLIHSLINKIVLSLGHEKSFLEWEKSSHFDIHRLKHNKVELAFIIIHDHDKTLPLGIETVVLKYLKVEGISVHLDSKDKYPLENAILSYLLNLEFVGSLEQNNEKLEKALNEAIKSL